MSPAEAVEAILDASGLPHRIATALYVLDKSWPAVPGALHSGVIGSGPLVTPLAEPVTFDEIDPLARRWLSERSGAASWELLVRFLMVVDQLLAPFARNESLLDLREDGYPFGDDAVFLWIGARGLAGVLRDIHDDPRLHQDTDYLRVPDDYLTWIRHAIGTKVSRPVSMSAPLRPEVRRHFDALWGDETLEVPLRIGLFSLRGEYHPDFTITAIHDAVDGPLHRFRAGGIANADAYAERVAKAIETASDPERWMQIVVFPEFMMTPPGEKALLDAIDEQRRRRRKPPLLVFAGSRHETEGQPAHVGNCCRVYSCAGGKPLWTQWKRIPYGGREDQRWMARVFSNYQGPAPPGTLIRVQEDIDVHGDYVVGRTPLGTFAVAICSDMMVPPKSDTPPVVWSEVPVDWVVIPAYTPATDPFLSAARSLAQSKKAVLFVNAFPAVRDAAKSPAGPDWQRTPRKVEKKEVPPVLSAFVNLSWTRPLAFWHGQDVNTESTDSCGVAINDEYWDGLVVDILQILDS